VRGPDSHLRNPYSVSKACAGSAPVFRRFSDQLRTINSLLMEAFLCGYVSRERRLLPELKWIATRGQSSRYGSARPMNRTGWITSHVLLCLILANAEGSLATGQVPESTQAASKIAHAVRVDTAPRLDGTLADPLWQTAQPITDFRQREPHEGQAPTERTEVRILYTRHEVYFGITCYDSDANGIVATELRRDLSQALDDYFEIIIDSTHDRRNAYAFQINPLGTQVDGLITEEGRSESQDFDPGWDGVWTSEARITDQGWTATVGIPFTTLNFTQSQDVVWGVNLKRFIRRKNEEDLWSAYRRMFGITKVSEAGELRGISDIGSGHRCY
jgi:cellulose/xylan binding protein with CBM9 domain